MTDRFETERQLKQIIEESLGESLISGTQMTSYRDHAGEPAVSIAVAMKTSKDIPDARAQEELTHKLQTALAELGDVRFPYLYFDALDNIRVADEDDEFGAAPDTTVGN
jgi:hypothetical protein